MEISNYFHYNCKTKENSRIFSTRDKQNNVTAVRKPFNDKNNLLNKLNIGQNDQYKGYLQNKIHTNKCYKPSFQGCSSINSDWKVTSEDSKPVNNIISRKMDSKKHSNFSDNETLMPNVCIESDCSENINKHVANTSTVVNIEQLSGKNLQKHLKKCNVIINDIFCNQSSTTSMKVDTHDDNLLRKKSVITSKNNLKSFPSQVKIQNEGHVLRDRRHRVNYAKFYEGSLFNNEKFANNSLRYKKKGKKGLDVYEFDSDSDNDKAIRKNSLDESVPFEKDMTSILYKIEKQYKKQYKRKKRVYNRNIQNIQKGVLEDFKKSATKPVNITKTIKNRNVVCHTKGENVNLQSRKKNQLRVANNDIHKDRDNLKNQAVNIFITNNVPEHKVNVLQNVTLVESTITKKNLDRYEQKISSVHNLLDDSANINQGSSEDLANKKEQFNNINSRSKLNRPDNQDTLNDEDVFDATSDHERLSDSLDFDGVNFNSTSLNIERSKGDSTPWRPNLHTNRNPHFLQYKSTCLPSYNQEMVIDSSAVEQMHYDDEISSESNHPKKIRQSSILSYVGRKSRSNSPDIIESSLFDIHELSPIKSVSKLTRSKSKSIKSSEDKENLPLKHTFNKGVKKVKRQILGEKLDTSHNILNNFAKSSDINQISDNIEDNSYFGFENLSDTCQNENEIEKTRKKQNIWLFGKPLRLDDVIKTTKKSKHVIINEREQNEKIVFEKDDLHNDELGKNKTPIVSSENQVLPIGLFEDLEPDKDVTPKCYERKIKKRARRKSINYESDEEHLIKKPKNKRTRQEEEEAAKWAAAFNKMCREVDKYTLEIE